MKISVSYEELEKVEVRYKDAVFYVKPLTVDELTLISSKFTKKGEIPEELQAKYALEVLERAIVGWKGLKDAKNREIPFKKEYVKAVISALTKEAELISELLNASMKLLKVIEEEGKK